ncbi:MAG: 3D domain-containing protein, partial [Bacillus sp. (in: firmicutes)]
EPIAFDVVKQSDNSIEKGKQKVIDSGKEGKREKHYEVVKENGKEISRKLLKTETVEESKNRVVALGTKPAQTVRTASVSRNNDSVEKEFYVNATAYTAHCSGCSGTTATGVNLRANPGAKVIAVDPSVIPLGTKVHVEGYGYAVAADTGSAIKGNKIDVFISSKSAAYQWGSRQVKIKVLE